MDKAYVKQRRTFALCWLGGIFAGASANLFTVMLPQAIGALSHGADLQTISQWGAAILSLFLAGWMLGGIAIGALSDRCGRVKAMSLSIALYSVFTALASLCTHPWQLGACRFLTGVGVGGELVAIAVMLAETVPSQSRAMAIGALITSYQIGVFLSGFMGSLFPDWRTAFALAGLPLALAGLIYFRLDESPKWIEACKGPRSSAGPMKVPMDWRSIAIGGTAFGGFLIAYWASAAWVPTWIRHLAGPGSNGAEQHYITMAHGLAAILGCLLAGCLAERTGRRKIIIIAFTGAFGLSIWMFLMHASFHPVIYLEHALLGLFIGIGQAIMYIYIPELFTTEVRGKSTGICLNLGRAVTASAVLMIAMLVSAFGGYAAAMAAFAGFYLVGALAALFGPETTDH